MYMRCLFTCIFAFCLCSGYAQGWKGAAIEGTRRAAKAAQSKDVRIPKVVDAVVQKIANVVRKEMLFRDSMLSIAKTDTFGIVCQVISKRMKVPGLRLSDMQKRQYATCVNFLIKQLIMRESAYPEFLKEGISKQTVEVVYQMAVERKEKMKELNVDSQCLKYIKDY